MKASARLLLNPVHCLALGFGSGLSPLAPGTAGSLVAIPFYLLLHRLDLWIYTAVVISAFFSGIFICGYTAKALKTGDPKPVVWDEIVGLWLTFWAIPLHWYGLFIGFLLFRFFDALKPWPISWVDRTVKGGLGIMLDDLLAAVAANLVLRLILHSGLTRGFLAF